MHPEIRLTPLAVSMRLLQVGLLATAWSCAHAEDSLADLSLEELTSLKVSSVSKKTQRLTDAPAAAFVITQDDIRRSGATSIPQALRLVPGLQVAQLDGNKWAISARGFNSRFANRLLVLMDGRTLYTLTFGGVFWDVQDTMIEDIERIEVVRGPGGAIWGTNAFNGVINIITKHASQTGGALVSVEAGTERPLAASARIGEADGAVKWRAFAKGFAQEGNHDYFNEEANDEWRQARVGGRADIDLSALDSLQISAEAYTGTSGAELWDYAALPNFVLIPTEDEYDGAFATAEWSRTTQRAGQLGVRAVVDYTNRSSMVFDERRHTYDLEVQHNLPIVGYHDVLWGLGVRHTDDTTHETYISVVPPSESLTVYHGYIQDEIAFFEDALHVVVGGRVEHSDYIGTQFMPNLRARYTADDDTTLWAAVSRGVRSASRLERNVRVTDSFPAIPPFTPFFNPTPAPLGLEVWGDQDFGPEKLKAFEAGWRQSLGDALSFDLAAYYNEYSDMRGVRLLPLVCSPNMTQVQTDPFCVLTAQKIIAPMQFTNMLDGSAWGAELSITWNPTPYWRLVGSYSHLEQDFPPNVVDFGIVQLDFSDLNIGLDARNQWSVRSSISLNANWDWDLFLRRIDKLPTAEVDAYTELNTRIAWRPRVDFELALVGDNLLDNTHREFVSDFLELAPVSIDRAVRLHARWSF
jgi:iron complex outermembrane receptor protein